MPLWLSLSLFLFLFLPPPRFASACSARSHPVPSRLPNSLNRSYRRLVLRAEVAAIIPGCVSHGQQQLDTKARTSPHLRRRQGPSCSLVSRAQPHLAGRKKEAVNRADTPTDCCRLAQLGPLRSNDAAAAAAAPPVHLPAAGLASHPTPIVPSWRARHHARMW